MTTSQSIKAASVKADEQVEKIKAALLRRCRKIASDGDEEMAFILDNLDTAEEVRAHLRSARNGQPARKGPKPKKRRKPRKPKPKGPTLTGVQDKAIAAINPGGEMTVRGLFEWCQEHFPGVLREDQMAAFTSTFSKKVQKRDDITRIREHQGSSPALYMKVGSTVAPP